jgi:hypothetical protein
MVEVIIFTISLAVIALSILFYNLINYDELKNETEANEKIFKKHILQEQKIQDRLQNNTADELADKHNELLKNRKTKQRLDIVL